MTDDDLKRVLEALQQQNGAASAELREHFDESVARLTGENRYFDVAAEAVRHEVRLVAEAVASVGDKLDREAGRIDEKIERGFADTQAMIKFSHAELERRRGFDRENPWSSVRTRHLV